MIFSLLLLLPLCQCAEFVVNLTTTNYLENATIWKATRNNTFVVGNLTCAHLQCFSCEPFISKACLKCTSDGAAFTITKEHFLGVCDDHTIHNDNIYAPPSMQDFRDEAFGRRLLPDLWENCFPEEMLYTRVGIAFSDIMFDTILGSDYDYALVFASSLISDLNIIYEYQVGVKLELGDVFIPRMFMNDTSCYAQWNDPCDGNFERCFPIKIEDVENWLRCIDDNREISSWQVIDFDHELSGGGVAFVGSLCNENYNGGISFYYSQVWRTVAHELGHSFNATHPLDNNGHVRVDSYGIMAYGDGKLNGEYQFDEENKDRICWHLNTTICPAITNTSVNRTFSYGSIPSTTPSKTTNSNTLFLTLIAGAFVLLMFIVYAIQCRSRQNEHFEFTRI